VGKKGKNKHQNPDNWPPAKPPFGHQRRSTLFEEIPKKKLAQFRGHAENNPNLRGPRNTCREKECPQKRRNFREGAWGLGKHKQAKKVPQEKNKEKGGKKQKPRDLGFEIHGKINQ